MYSVLGSMDLHVTMQMWEMSMRWTGVVHGSKEESEQRIKNGKGGDTQTSIRRMEGDLWNLFPRLIVRQRGLSLLYVVAAAA